MKEWGQEQLAPIYNTPELPQMLQALHATFPSWQGELCKREATTLIHGDLHLGNMVFDAGNEEQEPILLDWQFFGSGDPALDVAYFFLMSLAPDPLLEERLLHSYCDAVHAAGVPEREIGFNSLQDRVDALMIEVVVHFTSVRAFGEAMKDPSYTLPTMKKKLASSDPSQVDAATAFIAVDSNALGRTMLLWKAFQAGADTDRPDSGRRSLAQRAARFFQPSCVHGGSTGAKL
jgi:hypothetical protein